LQSPATPTTVVLCCQATLLTQSPLHATQFNLAGVTILVSEPTTPLLPEHLLVTNAIITNFSQLYDAATPPLPHGSGTYTLLYLYF
jgi:hypothetical protein